MTRSIKIDPEIIRTHLKGTFETSLTIPHNLPQIIQTDSRKLLKGEWFWCLSGDRFDGHQFVETAMKNGALGFTYERSKQNLIPESMRARGIAVDNTLIALQQISRIWREQAQNCMVIGLTGSNGKTTVKELLHCALSAVGNTLATSSSLNNEIGVPLTLCQIEPKHDFAVIEMGARHAGDIRFLCDIARPNLSLLLNVGQAHIGEFGGFEILKRTKLEIFTSTPAETIAICLADQPELLTVAKSKHPKTISFGWSHDADIRILESKVVDGKQDLSFRIKDREDFRVRIPMIHETLAINIAATIATCFALGQKLEPIFKNLETFGGVSRRFQTFRTSKHLIIDDSYNANPQSMIAGLKTLKSSFDGYKKILLLGDMLELGEDSIQEHLKLGQFCQTLNPKGLVGVGPFSHYIIEGAIKEGYPPEKAFHFETVDDLRQHLDQIIKLGNLLYAKASNSIKLYKIIDELTATKK